MKLKQILFLSILFVSSLLSAAQDNSQGGGQKFRLYDLEYQIMPMIVNAAIPGELNEEALLDVTPVINSLAEAYNLQLEFNPADIKAEPFVRGDARGVVYTFPEPVKMPQAKYGAVVFVSVTENRYLTLESSINFGEGESKCWVLGETMAPGVHRNFGIVPDCDSPAAFVDLLEKAGKLKSANDDTDESTSISIEENK